MRTVGFEFVWRKKNHHTHLICECVLWVLNVYAVKKHMHFISECLLPFLNGHGDNVLINIPVNKIFARSCLSFIYAPS